MLYCYSKIWSHEIQRHRWSVAVTWITGQNRRYCRTSLHTILQATDRTKKKYLRSPNANRIPNCDLLLNTAMASLRNLDSSVTRNISGWVRAGWRLCQRKEASMSTLCQRRDPPCSSRRRGARWRGGCSLKEEGWKTSEKHSDNIEDSARNLLNT